jgi:serine/threonine protein kinase
MSLISLRGAEPIAGYSVTERLGAGGYGEVWKAEAPGGLQKAIKFIYGYLNEEKASRELKALNRIKQIRHPFLLSLERIEVVDGQLLIVTELADTSVKDRCEQCRAEGLPGIPRDELLNHLRDAADALDFLCASGLQHLDVKPENLLLVGGRVKVADFGLVKDIQDRNCSMMGGMTPAYAAPEVFDGRPNANSDQYSLAIVYQEMLTGVLPFPGATAAQLASQHLHSRPRLESLPSADRAVISRALAKNPGDRFPNSRALIDALLAAGQEAAAGADAAATHGQRLGNGDTTSASNQETGLAVTSRGRLPRRSSTGSNGSSSGAKPAIARMPSFGTGDKGAAMEVRDLPPLEVQPDEAGLRPTLYLGIGGTAGHVLKRLRRRLYERFGDRSATPVLQMLLIDSDAGALSRHSGAADQGGINPDEMLAIPLRKPEDYRPDSVEILQWLSRRWLYNIPRSLQTEGLRPLGRLALVDHANEFFDRVREALARCVSGEALAAAEKNTGLPIRDRTPRVFIVASLSGGAGSGMVLDVGYAVRMLLADMDLPDLGVCGLLTHSTSRAVQGQDLAIANAYACLNELAHYQSGGYPGEPACGIRAFEGHQTPFPTAYFVDLGERLNDNQFHQAVDGLAEYLYLDAATLGGPLLDKCRAAEVDPGRPPQLRTLGVCRLGCRQGLAAQVAEHLCHNLLMRWIGQRERGPEGEPPARDARLKRLVSELISQFELDADSLLARYRETIEQALAPGSQLVLDQLAGDLLARSLKDATLSPEARWQQLAQQVCQAFGQIDRQSDAASTGLDLRRALDVHRQSHVKEIGRGLDERLVVAADDTEIRLAGAQMIAELLMEYLRGLDQQLTAELKTLQGRLASQGESPPLLPPGTGRKAPKQPEIAPLASWPEHLAAHGRLLLDQWALHGTRRLVQSLLAKAQSVSESLMVLRRDTQRLAGQFEAAAPWSQCRQVQPQELDDESIDRAVLRELESRFDAVAARFEQNTNQELLALHGGLIRMLCAGEETLRAVPGMLRAAARWEVTQALKELDVVRLVLGPLSDTTAARERLGQFISAAWPRLLECGGAKRLLLLMPPCSTAEQVPRMVAEHRHETPSVVFAPGGELVACYEGEQIPLAAAAAFLVRDDPQFAAVAHRVHTRTDIEWCSL